MAAAALAEKPAKAEKADKQPTITYTPIHDGDPHSTLWNRHRFHANKPVDVADIKNGLTAAEMIELAKGNPWFKVEGFDQAKAKPSVPDTSEQYRGYAVGWIRVSHSTKEMARRWRDEEDLRIQCGCGEDDVEYIQTIYKARYGILREQEALAQSAVNE